MNLEKSFFSRQKIKSNFVTFKYITTDSILLHLDILSITNEEKKTWNLFFYLFFILNNESFKHQN